MNILLSAAIFISQSLRWLKSLKQVPFFVFGFRNMHGFNLGSFKKQACEFLFEHSVASSSLISVTQKLTCLHKQYAGALLYSYCCMNAFVDESRSIDILWNFRSFVCHRNLTLPRLHKRFDTRSCKINQGWIMSYNLGL